LAAGNPDQVPGQGLVMSLIKELKRRNVFRVAIAYGVAAWLLLQITDVLVPMLNLPDSAGRFVLLLIVIGFIPALIFAWAYEMTPEGIKREKDIDRNESITPNTGKKLDRIIISGLVLVIVGMGVERIWFAGQDTPAPSTAESEAVSDAENVSVTTSADESKPQESVAVLPFASMSSGEDDGYFADGLTEEILNSLAALPELLVTARTSSFHFKGQNLPVQEIAATLGVDHIVEGSVRRSGERVRITAQLIRANDGFHLWSDTYDRTLEDIFAVQEDIASRIAETLDVVLNDDRRELMRNAGIKNVEAFIAYQKGWDVFDRAHAADDPISDLPEANQYFDQALAIVPGVSLAHFLRSDYFGHIIYNHTNGFREASPEELEAAMSEVLASLAKAAQFANSESQRALYEAERLEFSDNWASIPTKLDLAFQTTNCQPINWVGSIAAVFGWADEMSVLSQRNLRCDPLSGLTVTFIGQNEIWAGRAVNALEVSKQHLDEVGFTGWVDDTRFTALMATGKYREDPGVFDPNPEGSTFSYPRRLFIHALNNNIAAAREILAEIPKEIPQGYLDRLIVAAALGDLDTANDLASKLDSGIAGPFLLSQVVSECYCGAPFDIEVTPNFKARIEEANFPWPPPSPIKYPAKDW
jgi:TolB-like protein